MGPYERMAIGQLRQIYRGEEVECEWYAFRGEGGEFYAPRVDLAVGPFALHEASLIETSFRGASLAGAKFNGANALVQFWFHSAADRPSSLTDFSCSDLTGAFFPRLS
jgi:hypothetical protein